MNLSLIVALFLFQAFSGCRGVEITDLQVPTKAAPGSTVVLTCKFNLPVTEVHHVKWYQDSEEFFRFDPSQSSAIRTYGVDGISVDESRSDVNKVTLVNVDKHSSGKYVCEVAERGPNFSTATSEGTMTVTDKCQQGEVWTQDCNTCTCSDEGLASCTKRLCATDERIISLPEQVGDPSAHSNVRVHIDETAHLKCPAENNEEFAVSWIRVRDLHLLTVQENTYTSDQRVSASYSPEAKEWILTIKHPVKSDSGAYRCDIAHKNVSTIVNLNVVGMEHNA